MYRGKRTFKCTDCGTRFKAPDFEYAAMSLSAPPPCQGCGSKHTRPWSLWPPFLSNWLYRRIREKNDKKNAL